MQTLKNYTEMKLENSDKFISNNIRKSVITIILNINSINLSRVDNFDSFSFK